MAIKVAGDIFQERMNVNYWDGHLPFIRIYLNDVLIITTGSWDEHCCHALDQVLEIMLEKALSMKSLDQL